MLAQGTTTDMTYNDLKHMLNEFTAEELNQTVTVYVRGVDEFHGLNWDDMKTSDDDCDVLDPGHKYLVI